MTTGRAADFTTVNPATLPLVPMLVYLGVLLCRELSVLWPAARPAAPEKPAFAAADA